MYFVTHITAGVYHTHNFAGNFSTKTLEHSGNLMLPLIPRRELLAALELYFHALACPGGYKGDNPHGQARPDYDFMMPCGYRLYLNEVTGAFASNQSRFYYHSSIGSCLLLKEGTFSVRPI